MNGMRIGKFWLVALMCGTLVALVAPVAAQDNQGQPTQTLAVSGTGEASGSPDQAIVQLGVELRDADLGAAFDQVNQMVEAIINALTDSGIEESNIQTTNLSIYQESPPMPQMEGQGADNNVYVVSNIVQVRITNIAQVSSVIETGLDAGANRVYGLTFGLQEPTQLSIEAMRNAVADANTRAQALAEELGVTLGDPVRINWGTQGFPVPIQESAIGGRGGAGGAVIREGQLSVTAQVDIVYAITPGG